jgi:hypothetical protein
MADLITSTNMFVNSSSIAPSFQQGGYTSLLLDLEQEASIERKLSFDEPANDSTFEQ